ncbi:PRC-barrel domain-containing protein, partial [Geodermatophilus maliterrae]
MALPDRDSVRNWVGMTVVGRDDAEIGEITHLLADDETGAPEWMYATVDGDTVVVPLLDATEVDGRVRVVVERTAVVAAPRFGESRELTTDQEAELYLHYGIQYSTETSESVLPVDEHEPVTPRDPEAVPDTPAPSVAQPGDSDFGLTERPPTSAAARTAQVGGAVAALLGVGAVVFSTTRR